MDICPHCGSEIEQFYCDSVMSKKTGLGIGNYGACDKCKKIMNECEVYSRVVGYLRPVKNWNKGKQAEFEKRKTYKLKSIIT